MRGRSPPCARAERGIGLLEILVAVAIVSVGFLGAARMQVGAMRTSHGTYLRAQAHLMAGDIVERIRANVAGAEAGHYDAIATSGSASDPSCTDDCTAGQIARRDLHDWSAHLHPFGRTAGFRPLLSSVEGEAPAAGSVTRTATGNYLVLVAWSERVDGVPTRRVQRVEFAMALEE